MTGKQEKAAIMVAQGELLDYEICAELGISHDTLWRWKTKNDEFKDRLKEHLEVIKEEVRSHGIAILEIRVKALQRRWLQMQQVIRERAEAPRMQDVPGGATGLLVHQIKGVGSGPTFQIVDEYRVDDGLLAELRAHEKQAAQELQQWTERSVNDTTVEFQLSEAATEFERRLVARVTRSRADGIPEASAGRVEGEEVL